MSKRRSIPGQTPVRGKKQNYMVAEVGSANTFDFDGNIRDDIVPELSGAQGRRVYAKMRADSTVSAIIFAIEMSLRRSTWMCKAKDSQDPKALEYSQFFDSLRNDMEITWENFISQVLSMLTYGWSFFEIVGKRRLGYEADVPSVYDDGKWGIRKLALRSQDSLDKWEVDKNGNLKGMVQWIWSGPNTGKYFIPINKALLFRAGYWKDSPEGVSPLRGAYQPWLYLQGINRAEAYGIERELNGLPVIYIPADVMKAAKEGDADAMAAVASYSKIVRDVRLNRQAGVILPSDSYQDADGSITAQKQYQFTLMSSNGTRAINVQAAAERHQVSIARCVLADFLMLGTSSRSGSQALGQSRFQFFSDALDGWNSSIADVLNRFLIPAIAKMNGMDMSILPSYSAQSVSPVDVQTVIECIERYVRAGGVLLPDPEVDGEIRDRLGLPPLNIKRLKEINEYDPTLDPRNSRYRDPNAQQPENTNTPKDPTAQGDRGSEGGAPKGNNNARKPSTRQNRSK